LLIEFNADYSALEVAGATGNQAQCVWIELLSERPARREQASGQRWLSWSWMANERANPAS